MPKISVIIPVYNSEKSIEYCLDGVLNQTYTDFDIVFTDDGSTDNTVEVINNYLKKRDFFNYRILSQKNAGPGMARNFAIDNTNADLLAFLDSDDVWECNHLYTLVDFFEKNDIDLVCTTKNLNLSEVTAVSLKRLLFRCYVQSSTLLVKKSLFFKTKFREGKRYSEDYDLWLRFAALGVKIVIIPIKDVKNYNGKNSYGDFGLSKNLWKMERSELENFLYLLRKREIHICLFIIASMFSIFKFILRINKTVLNKIFYKKSI